MALLGYTLAIHLLRAAAWPVMWWLGRRTPALRERWDERRGRAGLPAAARGGMLVHAASMGEVAAAEPLIRGLAAAHPGWPLVLTCTSATASALIRQRFGDQVHHAYLPFDTPGAVRRFLQATRPRLLVLMETELWPHLLAQAQALGVLVVVANARMSARSARSYARWSSLSSRILQHVDLLLAQDEATRERFQALGLAPGRIQVTGNLKFDSPPAPDAQALQQRLARLAPGRALWVAASTHEGEEDAVLQAHRQLLAGHPGLLLVLVPRHPQRFATVRDLLATSGLTWQARSDNRPCDPGTSVLLGDTMGELRGWIGLAQAVFMGGTLIPRGGHNPVEVIGQRVPLASGRHVFNFAAVFELLDREAGLAWVDAPATLGAVVGELLARPPRVTAMVDAADRVFRREQGATQRSLALIGALVQRAGALQDTGLPGAWIRFDPGRLAAPADPAWFEPAHWPGARALAGGRGQVWFVPQAAGELVLRHYRRGGLVGRWLGDRYVRRAPARGRGWAEHGLLRRLRGWDLPVPAPVAALVRRFGVFDRHDILVAALPGAVDLGRRLQQAPLTDAGWAAVGHTLARLHRHGVQHADLNIHNLLLDAQGQVAIIDFDRCDSRAPGDWMDANLQRLLRSLRKEQGRCSTWHWQEGRDWPALLAGYRAGQDGA